MPIISILLESFFSPKNKCYQVGTEINKCGIEQDRIDSKKENVGVFIEHDRDILCVNNLFSDEDSIVKRNRSLNTILRSSKSPVDRFDVS